MLHSKKFFEYISESRAVLGKCEWNTFFFFFLQRFKMLWVVSKERKESLQTRTGINLWIMVTPARAMLAQGVILRLLPL